MTLAALKKIALRLLEDARTRLNETRSSIPMVILLGDASDGSASKLIALGPELTAPDNREQLATRVRAEIAAHGFCYALSLSSMPSLESRSEDERDCITALHRMGFATEQIHDAGMGLRLEELVIFIQTISVSLSIHQPYQFTEHGRLLFGEVYERRETAAGRFKFFGEQESIA